MPLELETAQAILALSLIGFLAIIVATVRSILKENSHATDSVS